MQRWKNYTKKDYEKTFGYLLPLSKIKCNPTVNGSGLLTIKSECGIKFTVFLERLDREVYRLIEDLCARINESERIGKNVDAENLMNEIHTTCRNPFTENCTFGAFGNNFKLNWIIVKTIVKGYDVKEQTVTITLHSDKHMKTSHVLKF